MCLGVCASWACARRVRVRGVWWWVLRRVLGVHMQRAWAWELWWRARAAAREERTPPPSVVLNRQLEVGEGDRDEGGDDHEDGEDNGEDGAIVLEVESHEDGFLAKILLPEGEAAECDVAVGAARQAHSLCHAAFATPPLTPPWRILADCGCL